MTVPPPLNVRILGRLPPSHLEKILASMVSRNQAAYEPAKQTRAALIYWRTPEEWAEELHQWVLAEYVDLYTGN